MSLYEERNDLLRYTGQAELFARLMQATGGSPEVLRVVRNEFTEMGSPPTASDVHRQLIRAADDLCDGVSPDTHESVGIALVAIQSLVDRIQRAGEAL